MLEIGMMVSKFSKETFGELYKGKVILGDALC